MISQSSYDQLFAMTCDMLGLDANDRAKLLPMDNEDVEKLASIASALEALSLKGSFKTGVFHHFQGGAPLFDMITKGDIKGVVTVVGMLAKKPVCEPQGQVVAGRVSALQLSLI